MASGGGSGARILSSIRIRNSIGGNPTMMSSLDFRCELRIVNCGRPARGNDACTNAKYWHVGVRIVAHVFEKMQ